MEARRGDSCSAVDPFFLGTDGRMQVKRRDGMDGWEKSLFVGTERL